MTLHRTIFAASLGFVCLAGPLAAQPRRAPGTPATEGEKAQRPCAELEQQVRENFAAAVRKRLQLTDDQMTRLMAVNQRLDTQRRALFEQEFRTRRALRAELGAADNAVNQAKVGELLESLLRVQRSRLELVEREQRELSAFLNPVQRARYQAYVEAMQRRMDDMSDGRGRGDSRRGGSPGMPGGPGRSGNRPPPTPPPPAR